MRQPNLQAAVPHRVAIEDAARDGRVRRWAIDLYERASADWAQAPSTLARGFRGARELRSHERRFVGEAVYAMIRWRRRLVFLGRERAESPLGLYLLWLHMSSPRSLELEEEIRKTGIDPARLQARTRQLETLSDPVERLAVGLSYPDWLVERLIADLGADSAERLLSAMNQRAPLAVRANRLRNDRAQLTAELAKENVCARPIEIAPDALELTTHLNAYGLKAFREGRFELQDAGSQLIAELVAPPPGGLVLDACAGAGGKSLALGALLHNRGRLIALDVHDRKLDELRLRARRAGLTNLRALLVRKDDLHRSLAELPVRLASECDRVLCDAPCSGIGVLRRHPEARWRLEPRDLEQLPALQLQILETYATLTRPGGRLIYATCTVTHAENDAVIERFLATHPSFEEVWAKEILGTERALTIGDGRRLRVLPHLHGTDGFFAAVFRRKS